MNSLLVSLSAFLLAAPQAPPTGNVGNAPSGNVGRAPGSNVGSAPRGNVGVPRGTVGNAPSGNIGNAPRGNTGNAPRGNVGNAPRGNIGNAPRGNIDRTPSGNIGNAPSGNVGRAPRGGVDKAPSGNIGNAQGGNVGNAPGGNVGDAPKGNVDVIPGEPKPKGSVAKTTSNDGGKSSKKGRKRTPRPGVTGPIVVGATIHSGGIVADLEQIRRRLNTIGNDYQGRRATAVIQVTHAIHMLRVGQSDPNAQAAFVPAVVDESQPISDDKMRIARAELERIAGRLRTNAYFHSSAALAAVERAMNAISGAVKNA